MLIDTDEATDVVKVVDFGLAKVTTAQQEQSLTETGVVIGTPLFMSPEQCRGYVLDNRSDIYSLGCVMYATLTGKVPSRASPRWTHSSSTWLNHPDRYLKSLPSCLFRRRWRWP